jgi:hypothetical protein
MPQIISEDEDFQFFTMDTFVSYVHTAGSSKQTKDLETRLKFLIPKMPQILSEDFKCRKFSRKIKCRKFSRKFTGNNYMKRCVIPSDSEGMQGSRII